MKQISLILLIAFISNSWDAQAQDFSDRANQTINFHSNNLPRDNDPKWTFWFAQARFAQGDDDGGRSLCHAALNNLDMSDDPSFQLWGAMDCYLRWRNVIDGDTNLKDEFKNKLTGATGYSSHNTTNKDMMNAAARYLAEQTWGAAAITTDFSPEDPNGVNMLNERIGIYTHQGEYEHNSPTYFAFHYGPLRSIADLASNSSLGNKAYLAAEWMLVSAAGEWLAGHMVSSAERIAHPRRFKSQNFYDQGNAIQWLYFGGPTPASWEFSNATPHAFICVQGAVSSYRLPEMVYDIANARNSAFTHREVHVRAEDRLQWYLTDYINQDYGVYSQHEEIDWTANDSDPRDWPTWLTESQRWGIVWKDPVGISSFYIKHPQGSGKRAGADRYGQVLQHQGAIVGVYDVPSNHPHPYLLGRIPSGYNNHIDNSTSGKIYLDYGVVMIALYMTKSFNWNDGDESLQRGNVGKIGLVVEVVPGNAYSSLASFKAAVEPTFDAITWSTSGNPRLTYTTLSGTQLDTKLYEYDKVDGANVNYSPNAWKLLDNPWTSQNYNSDVLTLNINGKTRTYNFGNYSVSGSDPVAYYPLNGNALDFARNHNGNNGGVDWVPGILGRAADFDGNDHIEVPVSFSKADRGSVSMWIKTNQNSIGMLFYGAENGGDGFGGDNELHLNMTNGGKVEFFIEGSSGGGDVRIVSSDAVNNDQWHHIISTWDVAGKGRIYIDGIKQAEQVHNANAFNFSGSFYLGRPGQNTRYYAGRMDEVRLYDRVISAQEIADLYYQGRSSRTSFSASRNSIDLASDETKTTGTQVYPNPAQFGKFTVETSVGESIQVMDASGRVVLQQLSQGKTELDISNQPDGLYLIRVGPLVKKILK